MEANFKLFIRPNQSNSTPQDRSTKYNQTCIIERLLAQIKFLATILAITHDTYKEISFILTLNQLKWILILQKKEVYKPFTISVTSIG